MSKYVIVSRQGIDIGVRFSTNVENARSVSEDNINNGAAWSMIAREVSETEVDTTSEYVPVSGPVTLNLTSDIGSGVIRLLDANMALDDVRYKICEKVDVEWLDIPNGPGNWLYRGQSHEFAVKFYRFDKEDQTVRYLVYVPGAYGYDITLPLDNFLRRYPGKWRLLRYERE